MTNVAASIIAYPTPLVQGRAARRLAAVQGEAMGAVAASTDAAGRLDTRRLVDSRSDDCFKRAWRAFDLIIANGDPDAAQLAKVGRAWLIRGLEIDALEDEHCDAARGHVVVAGDYGRKAVGGIQALLSPCDDDLGGDAA